MNKINYYSFKGLSLPWWTKVQLLVVPCTVYVWIFKVPELFMEQIPVALNIIIFGIAFSLCHLLSLYLLSSDGTCYIQMKKFVMQCMLDSNTDVYNPRYRSRIGMQLYRYHLFVIVGLFVVHAWMVFLNPDWIPVDYKTSVLALKLASISNIMMGLYIYILSQRYVQRIIQDIKSTEIKQSTHQPIS